MADEYKAVLTGGLSLKGGLFKSKKKKGKRKREEAEAAERAKAALIEEELNPGVPADDTETSTSGSDSAAKKEGEDAEERASEEVDDMLTPAQRRFRDKQLKREGKQIRNMVEKTHRERVEDFNALLASMTEHNDIPRCSAAGNG